MENIEKFIFIITYGRSGSTILMKILNSIEDADIKGENFNTLFPLYHSWQFAKNAKNFQDEKSHLPDHPWYGVNDINPKNYAKELAKVFIKEILNPKKDTRITGFKEIMYVDIKDKNKMSNFIEFLKEGFENIYIIFNRRNLDDVANSGWWKKKPKEEVIKIIKPLDDWMVEYHRKNPEYTYIVNYDEYKNNPYYFKGLFEFLGEDFNEQNVAKIMEKRLNHLK